MKKEFTKAQLDAIIHSGTILRTADIPFTLANKVNAAVIEAVIALKQHNAAAELASERKILNPEKEVDDIAALEKATYQVEVPDIKQAEFAGMELNGFKESMSAIGLLKWHYRDAYFNLIGLIIL